MYLGIDIGGTKTLAAKLSDDGQIIDSRRFPSSQDYSRFLRDLEANLQQLQLDDQIHCCAGVPGLLNRQSGVAHALGNLPWRDVPIRDDISHLIGGQPVLIENDARLAGLSEAQLVKDTYNRVLYLTVSTGLGGALLHNGRIARVLEDMEIGKMPLLHNGTYIAWEDFASGHAIAQRLNKQASEITAPADWQQIGADLAQGLGIACSVLQPEVIVLGGGVGTYADRYSAVIMDFLATHLHAIVRQPKAILTAQRPDEGVIYGCYDLARQTYQTKT